MCAVFMAKGGLCRFGKRTEDVLTLIKEAMNDSDITEPIDALILGTMNPEQYLNTSNFATAITDNLNLSGIPSIRVETASSTGAAALHAGFWAVQSGLHKNVLIVCAEKMTHLSTPENTRIISQVMSPHERLHGSTMPAQAALVTRAYMHRYGMTTSDLAEVAIKNHRCGINNPAAHFRKEITLEDIQKSKIISDPLRLYDCSPISDGAAVALLTSKKQNVRITGIGQGTDILALQDRADLTSFAATKTAAKRAYEMANTKPSSIDLAEVHDAFTPFEIIGSEDLCFFEPGTGHKALKSGDTDVGGILPINISGGLKSRGHPMGASGLAQTVELLNQLTNKATTIQIDNAKRGLAMSIGGFGNCNLVTIMEAVK